MPMDRRTVSSMGGKALVAKRGRNYMAEIGYKGAVAFWAKYRLVPCDSARFAIVDRTTGKFIGFMN